MAGLHVVPSPVQGSITFDMIDLSVVIKSVLLSIQPRGPPTWQLDMYSCFQLSDLLSSNIPFIDYHQIYFDMVGAL